MKFARAAITAMAVMLAGCDGNRAPHIGDALRPFKARNLAGETIELPAAAAGKVLILRFWATWCPFCREEMKAIEQVWKDHRGRGLVMLAVNAGQTQGQIASFIDEIGVTYPILLDPGSKIARSYGVTGLPMTFVIGRDGRVAQRVLGEVDAPAWRKLVEPLL